jgi:hypothetical protein
MLMSGPKVWRTIALATAAVAAAVPTATGSRQRPSGIAGRCIPENRGAGAVAAARSSAISRRIRSPR